MKLLQKIKKILTDLRELIWPLLEKERPAKGNLNSKKVPKLTDANFKNIAFPFALKMYEEEKERIKIIESKASLFIGLFASIFTIIGFLVNSIIATTSINYLVIILYSIILLYASRVLWYAIKALEREKYMVINETIFLETDKDKIIQEIMSLMKKNYATINHKVDNMTLAQKYIKRIIVVFFVFAICLICYGLIGAFKIDLKAMLSNINDFQIHNEALFMPLVIISVVWYLLAFLFFLYTE